MNERLLTARELSELLSVSSETVLRWTRAGKLPAIRLPSGAIRYRPAVVDAWLLERQTASTAAEESPDTDANRARRGGAYPAAVSSVAPDTDRGGR